MAHKKIVFILFIICHFAVSAADFDIRDFGAKADGQFLNTKAIQTAIDKCHETGGGTVMVPAGIYLAEMIKMKDAVCLYLSPGAVIKAVNNHNPYSSLIIFDKVEGASIKGTGKLWGNGKSFEIRESAPNRPYIVYIRGAKNIHVENVELYDGAAWALRIRDSERVIINGVIIYSHANFNNDGIDIDGKDIIISNCIIDSGDDAICLKSDNPKRFVENVTINNCILASNCNFIKMGTSSLCGFRNISISNCSLRHASESPYHEWNVKSKGSVKDSITGIAGIALEIVDGGTMEQVTISNITMTGVQTPIFIRLGSRKNPTGSLKNIVISNIAATSYSLLPSSINAVPDFYVENVILRDIIITNKYSTSQTVSEIVPENENAYPENRMFGWTLPSYGFYVRHAKNIIFDNVRIFPNEPDSRPAFWLEDTKDVDLRNSPGIVYRK